MKCHGPKIYGRAGAITQKTVHQKLECDFSDNLRQNEATGKKKIHRGYSMHVSTHSDNVCLYCAVDIRCEREVKMMYKRRLRTKKRPMKRKLNNN